MMGPSCTPVLAVVTRIYPSVKAHNAAHAKLIPLLKRKHFICKRKAGAPLAVWGERMGTETRREAGTLLRGPRGQPPLACVPHLSQLQRGPCLGRPRHPKARFPSSTSLQYVPAYARRRLPHSHNDSDNEIRLYLSAAAQATYLR